MFLDKKYLIFAEIRGATFADFGPRPLRGKIRKIVIDFFLKDPNIKDKAIFSLAFTFSAKEKISRWKVPFWMKFRQGHNFSLSKVFAKLEFNELQNYPSTRFRRNWQSWERKSLENQHPYWLRCSRPNSKKVEKVFFFAKFKREDLWHHLSKFIFLFWAPSKHNIAPTPSHIFPWETKTCH